MTTKAVYAAIAKVSSTIAKSGISKARSNQAQGYKFRGIDDVYNALAPILAENNLCILPTVTERGVVERQNAKGTALFYVVVKCDFHFVSAVDGSEHVVSTYGEAMDSGDKATNKAMSAAYKYACMQAFCIPTEGTGHDSEEDDHEVAPLTAGLKKIHEAESLDALKIAWGEARHAAVARKDEEGALMDRLARLDRAKDTRRAQLTQERKSA